jgi:hypothetical protein
MLYGSVVPGAADERRHVALRTASPHVCIRDQNEAFGRASHKQFVLNSFYTQMSCSGYDN